MPENNLRLKIVASPKTLPQPTSAIYQLNLSCCLNILFRRIVVGFYNNLSILRDEIKTDFEIDSWRFKVLGEVILTLPSSLFHTKQ